MTVKEARRALRGKLKFGDDTQIKAHRLLEEFEVAKQAAKDCDLDHTSLADRVSVLACDCMEGVSVPMMNEVENELKRESEEMWA